MNETKWSKKPSKVLPVFPSVLSAMVLLFQQIFFPDVQNGVVVNILLLVLNLIAFLPSLYIERREDKGVYAVGIIFVFVIASFYNIVVCGGPSPLHQFTAFANSTGGLWVAILIAELLALAVIPIRSERTSAGNGGTAPEPSPTSSIPRKYSKKSWAVFLLFLFIVACLPLIPLERAKPWFQSVSSAVYAVFGGSSGNTEPVLVMCGYLLLLFTAGVALFVGIHFILYLIEHFNNKKGGGKDFFSEYGTPIALLIVAGTAVVAANQKQSEDNTDLLNLAVQLFGWMILVVVGIIALFVMFETARLILKQCTESGSLLKTSMHLIFILIVQYTMGILTGLLRIFAIRDVIESLLLFFMPDLKDSMEPKISRILKDALDQETENAGIDLETGQNRPTRTIPAGFRSRKKRGGY